MTANVIVDSMYAACDGSWNDYLMMESIVDYWKNDKATTVPYQKVVHRGQSFMQRSTVVWKLSVKYRYGSTSLQALKD